MDSFDTLLGAVAKVEWVADRLPTLASIQPRHIGRICSFDYFKSATDPEDYDSVYVLGTLDGVSGQNLLISGDIYFYARVSNLKSYRKEIKK